MKYTYLLINVFTILLPLLSSFEGRLKFYTQWKYYLPANFFTATVFLIWDYFKTKYGVWGFNHSYIVGLRVGGLPLEEILFFITVPYSCTFIYASLTYFLRGFVVTRPLKMPVFAISAASVALSFLFIQKAYTFSVLLGAGLVLPLLALALNPKQLHLFLLTYLISLLPMAVVNGLLTALPVVVYNNSENLNIRLGTIPAEDFIYCLILLGMNIGLYEWLKAKWQPAEASNSIGEKSVL
jgi:lycopene cyclase domain-containing protein